MASKIANIFDFIERLIDVVLLILHWSAMIILLPLVSRVLFDNVTDSNWTCFH